MISKFKTIFISALFAFVLHVAHAAGTFVSADSIINRAPDDTQCATAIFANALRASAESGAVDEFVHETDMQAWIYSVFGNKDVLERVLVCPEIASADDDDLIKFIPIQYTFPNGREIIINYETQPSVLKQRIIIAGKRDLPAGPNSADLTAGDAIWTNVDPAWYAIMVVEHGALSEFVGENKNNTVSLKYIYDNIDKLYPRGAMCTSKTALAGDKKAINVAATRTVGLAESGGGDDTNDYYVAGDKDLGWIMYAEIALDVVITVATMGGGAVLAGVTKSARAAKILHNLKSELSVLRGAENVVKYNSAVARATKITKEINVLDKVADADKIADLTQELKSVQSTTKNLENTDDVKKYLSAMKSYEDVNKLRHDLQGMRIIDLLRGTKEVIDYNAAVARAAKITKEIDALDKAKDADKIADLTKDLDATKNTIQKLEKTDNVRGYLQAMDTYKDAGVVQRELRGMRSLWKAKRGNVLTRAFRTFKGLNASMSGAKVLNRGARVARGGLASGRAKDWLFHSTMANLGRLGKLEATGGALYGALKFVGGMWDYTESSTGDFTNNIEFKPLLLLSADDLGEGQDNVVNYGMWLLWAGDSISAADDDAAYLQAMDFAAKFYQDLSEQQNETNSPCNVDIFVVRPIIRNPGDAGQELYYLIMNDEPWSTANNE